MSDTNQHEPTPMSEGDAAALFHELVDRHHDRTNISDGRRMVINPGQVLDNIDLAMERLDLDIDTPISIEDDVVALVDLAALVEHMGMGPALIAHVLNKAMAIMAARYPAELVTTPLPENYDLRAIVPVQIADGPHELATALFNRRTLATTDLEPPDVADEIEACTVPDQLSVFVAVFYIYGTKLGALKHRTGIP